MINIFHFQIKQENTQLKDLLIYNKSNSFQYFYHS